MKIMALCDSPTLSSGFARVAGNLLRRWSGEAHVDCWAVGFVGWGYRRVPFVDTMFPAGPDWATQGKLELFLAQLAIGGYTHLWLMQDTFLLSAFDFPSRLREVCQKKSIHTTLYFPVDGALDPAWTDIIAAVDLPIAYTHYGKQEAEAKGRRRGHSFTCEVLPHGVDQAIYQPVSAEERARLRRGLWDPAWVEPDDFLMINVNANQRRKDVARSLEVLAAVRERGVPAKLLMHMPESSQEQLSLSAVGEQLGLIPVAHWGHSGPLYRKGNALLTEQDLAKYYNVADLYLTTSLGEGWGLGITEALGCGCMAAVPRHTACLELHDRLAGTTNNQHPTSNIQSANANGKTTMRVLGLPVENHAVVCDWDNSRVRHRVCVDGAADLIAQAWQAGSWRDRPKLCRETSEWLSWDRIATRMLRLMRWRTCAVPARGQAPLYLEYGGGLGDVLAQLFYKGSYNRLRDLGPEATAKVALVSHNPFVRELFEWHPKRAQIEVVECGYWHGVEAEVAGRHKFGLPAAGALYRLVDRDRPKDLEFYPSAEDLAVLEELLKSETRNPKPEGNPKSEIRSPKIIVLALAAGLPDRNVPDDLAGGIVTRLVAAGYLPVLVGRTYERHGRSEEHRRRCPQWGAVDLVDRLSVPGVCRLVQTSVGMVTCHSALNLLGWHLRKPQLLLYPQSVWERHFERPDQWGFGLGFPETVHAEFSLMTVDHVTRFLEQVGNGLGGERLPTADANRGQ